MPAGLEHVPFAHADFTLRGPNRFGLSKIREYMNLRWLSLRQANKAASWGVGHGVGAVWAVMQEQVIVSGPSAARMMGVPFHVSVHDVPSYLLQGRLGPAGMKRFERVFAALYRDAASRDVIWEPMRRHMQEKTGADAVVVMDGFERPEELLGRPVAAPRPGMLKILHSGMVYDANLLGNFIRALEVERDAGRFPAFEFTLIGSERYKPGLEPWPASARWRGWIAEDRLQATLEEADLFYLQHPFDEARREFAMTSFPAKLPGYLRARRPIVFHVPPWSSVSEFAGEHGLVYRVHHPDPERAARMLSDELRSQPSMSGYDSAVRGFDWSKTRNLFLETMRNLGRMAA